MQEVPSELWAGPRQWEGGQVGGVFPSPEQGCCFGAWRGLKSVQEPAVWGSHLGGERLELQRIL